MYLSLYPYVQAILGTAKIERVSPIPVGTTQLYHVLRQSI